MSARDHEKIRGREAPYLRGVPESTGAPMIAAFGVTLLFAGLITSPMVMLVGVICMIVGFIGWIRTVFPNEALEMLPIGSEIPEPAPRFDANPRSERVSLPEEIQPYRSGVLGGLIGGIAMAAVAIGWGVLKAGSFWMPINLLAGIFLPSVEAANVDALKVFHLDWFITAVVIHLVGCVLVGLVYAIALPIAPRRPVLFGGVVAPILWTGVLYGSIGIINPALEQHVSWRWFIASQVAFGVTCGFVISRWTKVPTMQKWSLQERFHLEGNRETKP
ncbi:MAG: hypothetical protein K8R92_03080 [Planctomycetes bacterium]|nr:hypothetical protein [Planctomycetota bacterium]